MAAPAAAPFSDRILPGVLMMVGFCLIAPMIDVFAKIASQTVPVGQVTAARFAVQAVLMAPIVVMMGLSLRLDRGLWPLVALRAVFLILSTFTFVAAVQVMPIADALAIVFVEPFILLLLGRALFSEQVGPRRLIACVVGFAGSVLVIQPSLTAFGLVALYPLGTAFSFAAYMLVTRSLSRRMHPVTMQYHTATIALLMCLPVLIAAEGSGIAMLDPVWPTQVEWLWLAGVGVAATVAHMFITYALRFAPSATLAPLHYFELVSAVILGYLVFADFPDALTWAGIGIIAASGLYIIHRERVLSRPVTVPKGPLP